MSSSIAQRGASEEGVSTTHVSDTEQTVRVYYISEEKARRAMGKLERALDRSPNRQLREGILLLKDIFGDLT